MVYFHLAVLGNFPHQAVLATPPSLPPSAPDYARAVSDLSSFFSICTECPGFKRHTKRDGIGGGVKECEER